MQEARCEKKEEARSIPLLVPLASSCLLLLGCATAPILELAPNYEERRPSVIAVLPVNNATVNMDAPEKFQTIVEEGIQARGYRILPSDEVKEKLEAKGIFYAGELALYTKQEISEIVGADGLLFVTLLDWNKTYLFYYYSLRVGAAFELYDGRSGDRLWHTRQEVLKQIVVTDEDAVATAAAIHTFTFIEPYARMLAYISLKTLPEGPYYTGGWERFRPVTPPHHRQRRPRRYR